MDKSLIVNGKTIEAALERAAILLHCPVQGVSYEVIQQGRPARKAQEAIPYKLKASAMSAKQVSDAEDDACLFRIELPDPPDGIMHLSSADFVAALDAITDQVLHMPTVGITSQPCPEAGEPIPEMCIIGDLTPNMPVISFDGSVTISGTVRSGCVVTVGGHLRVEGDVEHAAVDAGGNITVKGSIMGTVTSHYGTIQCAVMGGATATAVRGSVIVEGSATQSEIYAKGAVSIHGTLSGGSCYGEMGVELDTAGTHSAVPTVIYSGINKSLIDRVEGIRQEAVHAVAMLGSVRDERDQLAAQETSGRSLDLAGRVSLWRATAKCAACSRRLMDLSGEKSALLGKINEYRGARVGIRSKAHPKVKIIIDDCPLELSSVTHYASFSKDYDAGKLRAAPYK